PGDTTVSFLPGKSLVSRNEPGSSRLGENLRESSRVDVTPGKGESDAGALGKGELAREQRGRRDGARGLHQELAAQQEEADRLLDLLVRYEQHVGEIPAQDREREGAGRQVADPVGDGGRRWDADALALPEGEPRVVGAVRLDAVDLHLGPQRP